VLTTHYMDEAEALCDRVAIMDAGRILELDTPAALVRGLDAPVRITVVVDGAEQVIETREPARVLADLAARDQLEGLSVKGGTLEDVFLDLTGREYRA
jgi:ABC-2 type transport system ATP-binding protein